MDVLADSGLNVWNIILMVFVGAMAGSLAGFIIRGNNYGFIVNSVLGIFGAVVGGAIFNALNITPGRGIVKMISETFQVNLPLNFVGKNHSRREIKNKYLDKSICKLRLRKFCSCT